MQSQPKSLKSTWPPASIRWKDVIKIMLAAVLIGVVFSKTSLGQVFELSKGVSWAWLLISFLLFCLTTAFKGVQYWALLGYKPPYSQVFKIVVYQNALSNLVANTAGIASYFAMFRMEQKVDLKRSGVVFIITKIGDLFSMGLFLFISSFLVWERIGDLHRLTLVLLAGMLAGFMVFITIVLFRMRFVFLVRRIVHWLRLDRVRLVESGLNLIQSLAEQDRMVFIRTFFLASSLSMVYMTATMIYFFSRTQVFHIPIDFWACVYIISLFQFISMIPIQVLGGLGVSEFVTLYFYALFGIVYVDIPAALIGGRVLSYLFYLISLLYAPMDILLARFGSKNKG
ncbi:MAG: UPF0104 family protein [Anaerolineaceae bacterium]|nr:MAG: UPF0104 family protein [Anaerolineaceae bacterium]